MNKIQIFNFKDSNVRTIEKDGQIWWVAKDVCDILEIQNPTQAVGQLDDDERAMFYIGRQGETNIISESGLYALIIRSNKPNARLFRKWVTSEVLPAIKRTGSYTAHKSKIPTLESIAGLRKTEYGDKLTNAIAKEVWAAVDKVYLKWLTRARAAEALQDFKRQVGRI